MEKYTYTYPILDTLKVTIRTPYSKDSLDELFEMAARINLKRSFLFVSRVLAKHLPCSPENFFSKARQLGAGFASQSGLRMESGLWKLPQKTLFIGFAETATGLAQGVFKNFTGPIRYIHTTRDVLAGQKAICFQEEHSHATDHYVYLPQSSDMGKWESVVLIDDELTSGKTALNIISELHEHWEVTDYWVLSLLDWRSQEHQLMGDALQKKLGITLRFVSLVNGTIHVTGGLDPSRPELPGERVALNHDQPHPILNFRNCFGQRVEAHLKQGLEEKKFDYNPLTGRFSVGPEDQKVLEEVCKAVARKLSSYPLGKRILVLGFEELIYIPVQIGAFLEGEIYCQSITRSPIYPSDGEHYPIRSKRSFESPKFGTYQNYLYGVADGEYDTLLIFLEGSASDYRESSLEQMAAGFSKTQVYWIEI